MNYMVEPDGSMRVKIAALKVGDSFSRAGRVDFDSAMKQSLAERLELLRSSVTPSAGRASNDTGNQYLVETGKWITEAAT